MSDRTHVPIVHIPRPKKAKKGLSPRSKRGIARNREYKKLKDQFLIDHPYCQHYMAENGIDEKVAIDNLGIVLVNRLGNWCYLDIPRSSEIHHKKGRGKYHLDVSTWMATREGHSLFIHGDPKTAYERGYMLPRT
jgi:hypothetical protein